MALCDQVVDALARHTSCWDQGMLNVLVWSGAVNASRVVVWGCFDGPVRTLDAGGARGPTGRWFNERGAEYALVHKFRRSKNSGFFDELGRIFPPRPEAGPHTVHCPRRAPCTLRPSVHC